MPSSSWASPIQINWNGGMQLHFFISKFSASKVIKCSMYSIFQLSVETKSVLPNFHPNSAKGGTGASQMVPLKAHTTSAHLGPMQVTFCICRAESCPYWLQHLSSILFPGVSLLWSQHLFLDMKVQPVACRVNCIWLQSKSSLWGIDFLC